MRILRLSLLTLFVAVPLSAFAQDTLRVDSTRVAREYDLAGLLISVARPALTTGGASAVVLRLDSLGTIPAPTMEDVLRTMPLIVVRQNSRGEAQPALRGSEERQIGVFMDGVPLTVGWDHRTDMSIIPLTAARSIRLVRGLSSVLYGPNTLGGVIEIDVARVPERVDRVDPMTLGFALDETGGSNVSVGAGRLYGDDNQWLVRAGGGFQHRNGVTIPGGVSDDPSVRSQFLSNADGRRLNSDVRRSDAFFAARYRNDRGNWASLATSAYDVARGVPPETHQDGPRLWRYPDQRRLFTAFSAGTGTRSTVAGRGDIEFSFGYDAGSTRIDQYATGVFETVVGREEADDRTLTLRLVGEHTVAARGELRTAWTYADVSHDEVLTPGGPNSYRQRLWSFGVESEWRLGAREVTRISLGAVADGSDTPETGDKPRLDGLTDYGFRVGITSLTAPGLLLHAGVSRRARFPSLRELYSGALGLFEPNPDLTPESLWGAEGGFTLERGAAQLQIVGFHQRLQDAIARTSFTNAEGNRLFKRVNRDEIRSTGLEVLAVGTLGHTTFSTDLTLQDVNGIGSGGEDIELEYKPKAFGKIGFERPLGWGFRGSGDARFVSGQMCENPESGGLQPLDAHGLVDFSLRRIFRIRSGGAMSRVDASLAMRNASDASAYDQCGLPQPGRTLQLQFRLW